MERQWRNRPTKFREPKTLQLLAPFIRRTTPVIYSPCLPALLHQPGAVYSTYKHLKKMQPATEQQSHGAFDLHLQVHIIMLCSSAFHSSLLSSPALYPCSPSHHLHLPFQTLSAPPISPQAPEDAGCDPCDPTQLCLP